MAIAKSKAGYGKGWHKTMAGMPQKKRKSNARKKGYAGGTYANDIRRKRKYSNPELQLQAPLTKQSTKLPVQFSIIVPSTKNNKPIKQTEFEKRIKETSTLMSKNFGGDTSIKAKGGYIDEKGKLIKEKVAII